MDGILEGQGEDPFRGHQMQRHEEDCNQEEAAKGIVVVAANGILEEESWHGEALWKVRGVLAPSAGHSREAESWHVWGKESRKARGVLAQSAEKRKSRRWLCDALSVARDIAEKETHTKHYCPVESDDHSDSRLTWKRKQYKWCIT